MPEVSELMEGLGALIDPAEMELGPHWSRFYFKPERLNNGNEAFHLALPEREGHDRAYMRLIVRISHDDRGEKPIAYISRSINRSDVHESIKDKLQLSEPSEVLDIIADFAMTSDEMRQRIENQHSGPALASQEIS